MFAQPALTSDLEFYNYALSTESVAAVGMLGCIWIKIPIRKLKQFQK